MRASYTENNSHLDEVAGYYSNTDFIIDHECNNECKFILQYLLLKSVVSHTFNVK